METIPAFNNRVLVIDDDESVCDSFIQALSPAPQRNEALAAAAADLFGDEPTPEPSPLHGTIAFEVDIATNGRDGFARVQDSLTEDRPYAVIFVDMRMPGWDGLETVEHIRRVDQRCEIIFVTAYSDYSIDTLIQTVGANVGYFLKPFATDEVKQMATKGVIDWNKAREMERFLDTVTALDGETEDIEQLLRYFLGELCLWIGTGSGALAQIGDAGALELRIGRGGLSRQEDLDRIRPPLPEITTSDPVVHKDCIVLPIKEFGFAIALPGTIVLTPERLFLLRIFLEHASLAIRNSEARSELVKSRRLSAMGEALGRTVHDIRGPLGNATELLDYARREDESLFPRDDLFDLIAASLIQVEAVVNDTLDTIRGQAKITKREVQLERELSRPLALIKLELELQTRIPLRTAIAPVTAHIDTRPLVRALRNLVINAGEALKGHSEPWVEIGARADGANVCLWVADNGPGIPERVRDRIFEPFVSAGKATGTGLGLASVKRIVDAHGGTIDVDTGATGTRFTLRLPG